MSNSNRWWPQADDIGVSVTINGRPAKIFAGSVIGPWGEPGCGSIIVIPPATAPNAMPCAYTSRGEVIAIKELLQHRTDAEPDHSRIPK